ERTCSRACLNHAAQNPGEPRGQRGHRGIAPVQEVGARVPPSDVAPPQARVLPLLLQDEGGQALIHRVGVRYPETTDDSRKDRCNLEFHKTRPNQQRVTERASPAWLVSLYLLFM